MADPNGSGEPEYRITRIEIHPINAYFDDTGIDILIKIPETKDSRAFLSGEFVSAIYSLDYPGIVRKVRKSGKYETLEEFRFPEDIYSEDFFDLVKCVKEEVSMKHIMTA